MTRQQAAVARSSQSTPANVGFGQRKRYSTVVRGEGSRYSPSFNRHECTVSGVTSKVVSFFPCPSPSPATLSLVSSPSFCPRTGLGRLLVDVVVVVVEVLADTTQQTLSLSGAQVRWRVGGKGVGEAAAAAAEEETAGGAARAREVDRRSKRKPIMVSARRDMAPRVRESRQGTSEVGIGKTLFALQLGLRGDSAFNMIDEGGPFQFKYRPPTPLV